LINSGGYRIDGHHQIDFHVGVGFDRNAPNYIFGVGYSFRLDGFLRRDRAATRSGEAAQLAVYFFASTECETSSVWARFGLCDIGPHQLDGVSSPHTFGRCGRS
jgi:hypothetical protein